MSRIGHRLRPTHEAVEGAPEQEVTVSTRTVAEKLSIRPNTRPTSQVSVDEVWSAMRFRANEPGEAPFADGRQDGIRR